jgi:hypothetical protein
MGLNSAMSLPGSVRPPFPPLDLFDDQTIHPAEVAFAPPTNSICADCDPNWENGLIAENPLR